MKMKAKKIILCVLSVCIVLTAFLYFNGDIGVSKSNLEKDIRASQKIRDDWRVEGDISDIMAAFISYPQDKSDYTFSVYVNRKGLSFGYFFRIGGSHSAVDQYIAEYTLEGYDEKAYISMNTQKAIRIEIDDGDSVQVINLNENEPFAIVLPTNAGNITFFDVDGDPVECLEHPL